MYQSAKSHRQGSSRRDFIKSVLYASPLVMLGSDFVFGERTIEPLFEPKKIRPGKKIRAAQVGVFHRGGQVLDSFKRYGQQVEFKAFADVLFTDPDSKMRGFEGVPCYRDYREMMEEMHDEIDAVIVCTPDHSHFPAVAHAMLLGKHVYVEKPLAQNAYECRLLEKLAKSTGVVTQLGNQGHSGAGTFQFGDWVDAGLIKNVKKIDAWMVKSRRWHGWTITEYPDVVPPVGYDWDQWLSRRPFRPHSERMTGGNWRCWYEFGCGCMGDWGAHILDAIHRYLKLGQPYEVTTETYGESDLYYPQGSVITFKFKQREGMPPLELRWFDGQGHYPDKIPAGYKDKMGNVGSLIYSEDFTIRGHSHGARYEIIDEAKAEAVKKSGKQPPFRKNLSNHYKNFLNACQGIEEANSRFEVGAPLSEMLCLGCVGQKYPGTLKYDAKTMTITNNAEANKMLRGPEVRDIWDAYDKGKPAKSKKSLIKRPGQAKWEGLVDDGMSKWQNPYEWGEYEVVDGEVHLTSDKGKWFLLTDKEYANFVFEAEIKMPVKKGNSGFLFRCQKKKNKAWGYQAEVDTSDRKWSGGLYDEGRRRWFVSPNRDHASGKEQQESIAAFRKRAGDCFKQGQWNKYRIECMGPNIKIYVNDVLTTDVQDQWDIAGYIGLQHHGEKGLTYKFRNVRIKDLGAGGEVYYPHREEAARRAAASGAVENTLPGDVYEAESVVLGGGTKVADNQKGYQGKGFADFGGAGSFAHFDNVLADKTGTFKLTFRYAASDNNRACNLVVNGKKVGVVKFPSTNDWTTWKTLDVNAKLEKGGNSIKVVAIKSGPNLDAMAVNKA
ncbi:Endo-1,4-beta-xylanase B precursor [Anaerohalosphaera lusitana]|uniref:Endo-1,4-beta-xylanase B n=1 Tax=Anaerohalosphaera lusitana TaxID=1936003 RepID=A0A1U9NQM4_9BACT|nr:family 16 glycoside hydrolase [Anaerohalosphaera lusitana]AQT70232.1 Endo-1,4-beta-xylanase B precursor [Anaerohalosphaera lusitana]